MERGLMGRIALAGVAGAVSVVLAGVSHHRRHIVLAAVLTWGLGLAILVLPRWIVAAVWAVLTPTITAELLRPQSAARLALVAVVAVLVAGVSTFLFASLGRPFRWGRRFGGIVRRRMDLKSWFVLVRRRIDLESRLVLSSALAVAGLLLARFATAHPSAGVLSFLAWLAALRLYGARWAPFLVIGLGMTILTALAAFARLMTDLDRLATISFALLALGVFSAFTDAVVQSRKDAPDAGTSSGAEPKELHV